MPNLNVQNNISFGKAPTLEESRKQNGATDRGTKIIKNKSELDKNAFLKILAAELKYQNPFDVKDNTQFVSQLAQFSSMEQMTNLNSTMSASSAYALVGKTVAFNSYDIYGNQYGGVVQNVIKKGDSVLLEANVREGNKIVSKQFELKDLSEVLNVPDESLNLNYNLNFLLSSSLIGKGVEVMQEDGLYEGKVKSVYRDGANINLTLDIEGKYVKEEMNLKEGFSKEAPVVNGIYKGENSSLLKLKYNKENDKYEYSIDEGQWKEYKKGDEINGVKVTIPKENPLSNVSWDLILKAVEKGEKDVSSRDVLVVKNS